MLTLRTFKELIEIVNSNENFIMELEALFKVTFDGGPLVQNNERLIHAITLGFQSAGESGAPDLTGQQIETIEGLLYHFIYNEDCGNNSHHCKEQLVMVNAGEEDQYSVPCTNLDELYAAILLYLQDTTHKVTFNYHHGYHIDEDPN